MDDFRKYATKHLGMNGLVLDDVIKSQAPKTYLQIFHTKLLKIIL